MKPSDHVPLENERIPFWRERGELLWLGLVVLLGFVLRIIHLGTHSFWHDEIHVLIKSEHLSDVVLRGDLVSNHPPLFTVLVAVWRSIGPGASEWWVRLLPLILGLCGVVALYFLGRLLFGPRAGLFAAFLLTISPFHVLHSQDLKVYILLPFTGTVMVYWLYRASERNRPFLWALYGLTVAVACYSEFFAAPLLIGINLWFLSQLRGRLDQLRWWIPSNIAGVLLFLPQLRIALQKVNNVILASGGWWIPKPNLWSVVFYLKTIAFGYSNLEPHFKFALLVFCAFALAGISISWKQNRGAALLLIFWFAVPVTLVYVISQFTRSIFLFRAMLPYAIPFYLWVGLAVSRVEPRSLRHALPFVFACIAAFPLAQIYQDEYSLYEFPHRPAIHAPMRYREAAEAVIRDMEQGDAALHAGTWSWLPFYWYGFKKLPQYTHQAVATDSGWIEYFERSNPHVTTRSEFEPVHPIHVQKVVEGKTRFWYVFSEWEREHLKNNAVPVWRWLDAHLPEIGHMDFGAFEVFLYAKEQNGQPIRAIARDQDDGTGATMTYAGGFAGAYVKHKADPGIAPSPPGERRGNLTLRFDEERAAQLVSLNRGPTSRVISFAIENRSDWEVTCRAEFIVSDFLLDAASLYESRPESDVWTVSTMINPPGNPTAYEIPTAAAHVRRGESATLQGTISLSEGRYETFTYLFRAPGHSGSGLADIHLDVAEQDVLADLSQVGAPPDDWRWWNTLPVMITSSETSVHVSVTAYAGQDDEVETNLAYVGFRRVEGAEPPRKAEGAFVQTWPGEVTLPPLSTTRWSAEIDEDAKRVDIWVYERGTDGRAYRIFRLLHD